MKIARIAIAALLVAGCYHPSLQEGQFTCAPDDTRCPQGFTCDPCTWLCTQHPARCDGGLDGGRADRAGIEGGAGGDLGRTGDASAADLAGANDLSSSLDALASDARGAGDLAMAADLAAGVDAAMAPDLSIAPDLVAAVDLAPSEDLVIARPPDLSRAPDLVAVADLSMIAIPPDLAARADLTVGKDAAEDLSAPVDDLRVAPDLTVPPRPDLSAAVDLVAGPDLTFLGCSAANNGQPCAPASCGPYGACMFKDMCASDGTMARTCNQNVCNMSFCAPGMPYTEYLPCTRQSTDGADCGSSCSTSGACVHSAMANVCDKSGTQSQTCTSMTCMLGSCQIGNITVGSVPCIINTDGITCSTSCGPFGMCVGVDPCDQNGNQTRSCTNTTCLGGACSGMGVASSEQMPCTLMTDGLVCGTTTVGCQPGLMQDTCCSGGLCLPGCGSCQ